MKVDELTGSELIYWYQAAKLREIEINRVREIEDKEREMRRKIKIAYGDNVNEL